MSAPSEERASPGAVGPLTRRALAAEALWLALVWAASLWWLGRSMGSTPSVWEDTFVDGLFVRDCLAYGRCTAVGVGATVGLYHSATYLHVRALLETAGLGADGTYRVLLALNALGVALTALAARRLGGRAEGALAALVMVASLGVPTQLNVITDVAPVPFLGAVFALVATALVARPSLALTLSLGAVGGVIANVYATGVLCGPAAVLIALTLPRRYLHAVVAAFAFAASTFLLSPVTWVVNLRLLRSRHIGNAQALVPHPLLAIPMTRLAALALALWVALALARHPLRRRLDASAATLAALFVPFALGVWTGRIDPQGKYFSQAISAVAILVAVPAVAAARRLWARAPARWRSRVSERVSERVPERARGWVAPALGVVLVASGWGQDASEGAPNVRRGDLVAAARYLGARGWSWRRAFVNLKSPDDLVRRAALRWVDEWPDAGPEGVLERAYLVKVSARVVPAALPTSVARVAEGDDTVTLVAASCSWIDWRAFRACTRAPGGADETCTDTALTPIRDGHADHMAGIPGLPNPTGRPMDPRTLTLHFPLHPRADCPEMTVRMPTVSGVCPGRIVSAGPDAAATDPAGRWAQLRADPAAQARSEHGELVLEWALGGPQCWVEYRGQPPFFLEGEARTVDLLADLLTRHLHRKPELDAPPEARRAR